MSRTLSKQEVAQLDAMVHRTSKGVVIKHVQGPKHAACPSCNDTENQLDYGEHKECNHCGMRY